ncbi:MAG: MBL fold metallo-hydrolase [Cyanobacteria bacterium P01_E01_bin.35]
MDKSLNRSRYKSVTIKIVFLIMSLLGTIMLSLSQPLAPILAQSTSNNITIHNYYTSPPFEEINYYTIETDNGLILIDAGRLLSQARYALAELEQFDKPILAILITHPHTDHFGGLPIFVQAAGEDIPIYASEITSDSIENDRQGYIKSRNEQLGKDFPDSEEIPLPNTIVQDGQEFTVDGLEIVAYDFPNNEAETTTVYYLPEQEVMFVGDLVNGEKTPGLFEGNTRNWLEALNAIQQRFPNLEQIYPGHSSPDSPDVLIEAQIDYIENFRQLVSQALENDLAVDDQEKFDIADEIKQLYPDYGTSLLLPGLIEVNIDGVAEELNGEAN